MTSKYNKEELKEMIDNPENWNYNLYINKNDPRILVPKKTLGWTLNFGSIKLYIILLVIVCFAIFINY